MAVLLFVTSATEVTVRTQIINATIKHQIVYSCASSVGSQDGAPSFVSAERDASALLSARSFALSTSLLSISNQETPARHPLISTDC